MALAAPFRFGLKLVGLGNRGVILSPRVSILELRTITSKANLTEEDKQNQKKKPKPWNYKKYGYSNLHSLLVDGTFKRMDDNSKVIVVEGMPAVGKTKVAATIAEEFEMKHFPMITLDDVYINDYGYDLRKIDPLVNPKYRSFDIKDFVQNPMDDKTPKIQFQLFHAKWIQYMDALAHLLNTGQGVVLERSFISDSVFMESMYKFGYLNANERIGYYKLLRSMNEDIMRPHLVVYLDASIATIEENLKRRGQGEEKTFNKAFLEDLDRRYKHDYLKKISEHAEVLIYDWNTPGDSEILVEDIERLDFDKFEDYDDPKMQDWRIAEDQCWCEKRWFFTNYKQNKINAADSIYLPDCPRLRVIGEDAKQYLDVWENAPGQQYAYGYNADQGDKGIAFKTKYFRYKDEKKSKSVSK